MQCWKAVPLAPSLAALLVTLACSAPATGANPANPGAPAGTQSACVTQGMDPAWRGTGVESARQLVRSCLVSSAPTPGLCTGVPPNYTVDVLASEAWVTEGCANVGGPGFFCQELMAEVASFCHDSAAP
ncbi:MAG: hypothetical protein EXR82_06045 [Gammaproteobacteria bacterium]|nr:hypothetical protein [Gammaproteobacteria bacterium]